MMRRSHVAAWLFFLLAPLCLCQAAPGPGARAIWRGAADAAAALAENDAPRAYRQARHLQATLPADATPAERAQILNLLARIEIYLALTERAAGHARLALELATRGADPVGQAQAELNQALNATNQGQIDALLGATTHALAALDGVDRPELLVEALFRASITYRRIGQINESVTLAMQAMEIARRSNHPRALIYAHQGLGISFEQSERPEEARAHFLQMRAQARAAGSKLLEAYALTSLANAAARRGDERGAETLIREAIALFRLVGTPFGVNQGLYALAEHMRARGRHADAVAILDEIIASYAQYPNRICLWYALDARGASLLARGERGAALADARRGHELARQIGLPLYLNGSAQRMAAISAADGDYRQAYRYALAATDLTAKAARAKAGARMVELAQRYESESKQREIDQLTRRNQRQTAELRQRELQQRWLWTVLAGSVALLALSAFFLLRLRRSHAIIRGLNVNLEQRVLSRTAALRQQKRYLRTLIDTLPWRVWLKDTGGRYLALNQAAAAACALSADELVGKSDFDVRPRALAEAFRADDLEVMNGRGGKTVEERRIGAGAPAWIETFKAPVLDEDGALLGTVGFARDISERKAAEAAREAALAEAQRLAQARSDFLAQMSHELRTPLNGVLGYSQLLRRGGGLDERQLAGLNVIEQSGEHLLTLINDILDLAKIEAGKLELCPANLALPRFLKGIAQIVWVKAEQKGLDFRCDSAPGLPAMVLADEARLRQVLLNLLANAVKFTDRGHVRLSVQCGAPGRLRFEVRDSGIGIGAQQLETIFEPFEQAGELPRRLGGTGLGLAISRQFVQLMGGRMRVESRPGQGSAFWFELDLAAVDDAAGADPGPGALSVNGYHGARKTILVVDDVAENRMLALDMLGRLGFEMRQAADGAEALRQAAAQRPDLILLDIVMPLMDGVETARRLRALPGLEQVPIIALSASVDAGARERYRGANLNAFLPKPIDYDSLLAHIAALAGLDWTYQAPPAEPDPPRAGPALLAPPAHEMAVLHQLARIGNMKDIAQRAGHLTELDARYGPFGAKLQALAKTFQSQAILRLVEQYMETAHETD